MIGLDLRASAKFTVLDKIKNIRYDCEIYKCGKDNFTF